MRLDLIDKLNKEDSPLQLCHTGPGLNILLSRILLLAVIAHAYSFGLRMVGKVL